jgi:site-specific DNA recombinase
MKEKSRKTRCDISNINGNVLDESVMKELKNIASKHSPVFENLLDRRDLVETAKDALQSEIEVLESKLQETEMAIQNLVTAIEKG